SPPDPHPLAPGAREASPPAPPRGRARRGDGRRRPHQPSLRRRLSRRAARAALWSRAAHNRGMSPLLLAALEEARTLGPARGWSMPSIAAIAEAQRLLELRAHGVRAPSVGG